MSRNIWRRYVEVDNILLRLDSEYSSESIRGIQPRKRTASIAFACCTGLSTFGGLVVHGCMLHPVAGHRGVGHWRAMAGDMFRRNRSIMPVAEAHARSPGLHRRTDYQRGEQGNK